MTDPRRPNIVMILTDDHGSQAISAYGSVYNRTPRIDEIGERGVRFENCFATNALCSPSRASILTGTYSHVNGVTTLVTPIDATQPTFVSQLKAAGYKTAIVGKWHMGEHEGNRPESFDYWDILIGHDGQGEYWDAIFLDEGGDRIVEGYSTDKITDMATGWVDSLEGDDPWCVLIYHKAPHRPWEPHPRHKDNYTGTIPVPDTWDDDYSTRSASVRRALMRLAENLNTEDLKEEPPSGLSYEDAALWKYQRFMEDYLRCVDAVDENVGRVIDWLEERGEFDDTVLMYASDQGFFLGEHGWFDKRFMFEESLRMPMLMSFPRRVAPGQVHSGLVTNVDFAQTFLEAAGVPAHERMQGRSFFGDIAADVAAQPDWEGIYYRYWEHDDVFHHAPAHYGYRTERYKLIYYYNDGLGLPGTGVFQYPGEWELYDLLEDPSELNNLADDPAYASVRAGLTEAMGREQERLHDAPHPSQFRRPGDLTNESRRQIKG
ncbi:sulfatase [Actinotalea sp. M2MS4P-6]|uniref:sulfatase family protein n=1 Tax=Actinotalea sp. M2MS4P-6 TaxID=2983762 RepID=UPI0021E38156|nr:sulfatase [Actinotalea sp. M2MS4P-6]MCV2396268.1 sulfatase [Actinotalea sp. M2MS4P-6]